MPGCDLRILQRQLTTGVVFAGQIRLSSADTFHPLEMQSCQLLFDPENQSHLRVHLPLGRRAVSVSNQSRAVEQTRRVRRHSACRLQHDLPGQKLNAFWIYNTSRVICLFPASCSHLQRARMAFAQHAVSKSALPISSLATRNSR